MIKASNAAILLMVAFSSSGCNGNCIKPKTEEVRNLLEKHLKAGDSSARVEEILKKGGIQYSYDRFVNRYESTVYDPRCGESAAVSVYVYLDSSMKMSKFEVIDTYTAL